MNVIHEALATVEKSEMPIQKLTEVVGSQSRLLSGCLIVLQGWDDSRQELLHRLSAAGVPTVVFIVTKNRELLEAPANATILVPGEIPDQLANL